MNSKMLLNTEKLTESFSRRMQAYALLLDEKHQKAETTLSNTDQTASVAGLESFEKAIARYEVTDTSHMVSCVEVEQRLAEGFSQRMQSYVSALDAI